MILNDIGAQMAVSRPFVICPLSIKPHNPGSISTRAEAGFLQSLHCLSGRPDERAQGNRPSGRPQGDIRRTSNFDSVDTWKSPKQSSTRGGSQYTGPGFRIVRCFPKMSRREADTAVQVRLCVMMLSHMFLPTFSCFLLAIQRCLKMFA
jgi:hypothetical protein